MSNLIPIVFSPSLYASGCTVTYTSATTLTVASGVVRDSTNTFDIPVATPLLVSSTFNGVGGLDTGAIANNTLYGVFVIFDPTNQNVVGTLLSTSFTAPVMPSYRGRTYGALRLVDFVLTDGSSHFLPFYNVGNYQSRYKQYDVPIAALTAGAATSYTAVNLGVAVPALNFGRVKLNATYVPHAAGETASLQPTGGTGATVVIDGIVASVAQTSVVDIVPLISASVPKVSYALSVGTSPAALSLAVAGYEYFI